MACTPSGAWAAMVSAIWEGALELLAGLDHLLDQAEAQGLLGVELVAGEEPARGVAPAGGASPREGGAAEGVDAALDLDRWAKRVLEAAMRTSWARQSSMPSVQAAPLHPAITVGLVRSLPWHAPGIEGRVVESAG